VRIIISNVPNDDANNLGDNVLVLGDRPTSPNMITLKRGDYVVIRMTTKKSVKHFIGLIEEHNLGRV
jgi:hypothetical protein